MFGASFEAVTGRLGVGAIAFLGSFLVVDGFQIGVFELVEAFGKSASWGLVGVVPTVVVTYIVGIFCLGIAELTFARLPAFRGPSPDQIIAVSRTRSELLQHLYSEDLRNHELLIGASVAFVILAIGAAAEFPNMPGHAPIVLLSVCVSSSLAVLSLLFSRRAADRASALASAANAISDNAA